jgi:cytidylate kinase
MTDTAPVITIDGPSGSGKGTISRLLAGRLGWHFLDSGALYRITGLAALRQKVSFDDEAALGRVAAGLDIRFEEHDSGADTRFLLAGEDVSDAIRREECASAASRVAVMASVREALLMLQRDCRRSPGLVADGRDMGTVVFPTAELKIFLVASAAERAKRRHKQLKDKGIDGSLDALLADIEARDARDSNRSVSPLMRAEDAVLLDSTTKGIDEVVDTVLNCWQEVKAGRRSKDGVSV